MAETTAKKNVLVAVLAVAVGMKIEGETADGIDVSRGC